MLGLTLVAVCNTLLLVAKPLCSLLGSPECLHVSDGDRWHVGVYPVSHMGWCRGDYGGVVLVGWLPCQAHPAPRLAAVLGWLGLALAC